MMGQGKGRDVLILSGVGGAENAYRVDDRADISTVVATPRGGSGTDLRQQISRGAGGQSGHHILTVGVVEDELVRILGKARNLLRGGLVETLLLETHVKAARQQDGVSLHLLGIGNRGLTNRLQIFFQT